MVGNGRNIKKLVCNVELAILEQFGSDVLHYSIVPYIVLIKYYIYCCRFSGQNPCVSGVINVLKRTYETEIQSASFYQTPAIRERIVKK